MAHPPTCRRANFGFTLIEFLVTVAVLVIALGLAVPSLGGFVASNQAASIKSSLATAMALARSEAARAGVAVIVKAASGGSSGNELGNGWDLYLDNDGNGSVGTGDTLLRHFDAAPSAVNVHGPASIVFNPSGYLTPAAAADYSICRIDGSTAGYALNVAPSGITFASTKTNCPS